MVIEREFPFVTCVTDVVGFFAFLGLATWWFGVR
jgi:magnesium transporter